MAKKKVDEKKQVKKAIKKTSKKVVKSAKKGNKGAIALIALVVVLVIAIAVVFVLKPEIFDFLLNPSTQNGSDNNINNTPEQGDNNTNNGSTDIVIHEGDLTIHVMDVGQGDGILICFPDGKDMLIDCGNKSSGYTYAVTKAYIDTYVKDGQLDYLMLTHGDEDHVDQLDSILNDYQVDNIYMPNIMANPSNATKAQQVANLDAEKKAMFTDPNMLESGVYADFFIAALTEPNCTLHLNIGIFSIEGDGWKIDFFGLTEDEWAENKLKNAHEKNEISPIGILQYNGKRIVLTGDSNEENEPSAIIKMKQFYGVDKLDCDVLKVGHHGSETSSTPEFLDFITCEYAIISCYYKGNTFYHPRYNTLVRFANRDMEIFRTDIHGNIMIVISGNELTIIAQKQNIDMDELWTGFTSSNEDARKKASKGDSEI